MHNNADFVCFHCCSFSACVGFHLYKDEDLLCCTRYVLYFLTFLACIKQSVVFSGTKDLFSSSCGSFPSRHINCMLRKEDNKSNDIGTGMNKFVLIQIK